MPNQTKKVQKSKPVSGLKLLGLPQGPKHALSIAELRARIRHLEMAQKEKRFQGNRLAYQRSYVYLGTYRKRLKALERAGKRRARST